MPPPDWRIVLGDAAGRDLIAIIRWTVAKFGAVQARRYRQVILDAIRALSEGPDVPGARRREDLAAGIWLMHVARDGQAGRHFLVYRVGGHLQIEIVRILHDAMDARRHRPSTDDA